MRASLKDINKLQRASDLLDIYARDREDYDVKEYREAKRLSVFLDKFVAKILSSKGRK